jgi:hypothetical protein
MKGPRSRHRHNVKRIWECPACHRRSFAAPQVVTRDCECRGKDQPTQMQLIEPPRPRRHKPEATAKEFSESVNDKDASM